LNLKELNNIIATNFPKNAGVLLTGSQHNNETFTITSDIDVIVFEPLYSNINAISIKTTEGFMIDLVVAPVFNISDSLENESYDTKGSFLSMVIKGKILSDPLKILPVIISQSEYFFERRGGKTPTWKNTKLIELLKLKKHFKQPLSDYQKILLTSEAITNITELEVMRLSNWSPTRKHKADYLIKNNLDFTKQVYNIYTDAIFNTDNGNLLNFIDEYYQTYLEDFNDENLCNKIICVDIYIENLSPFHFYSSILPKISADLKKEFAYGYLSINKYHRKFQNNFTLCFNIENRTDLFSLLRQLSKTIKGDLNLFYSYTTFLEDKGDEEFEKLRTILCRNVANQFKANSDLNKIHFINFFCFLAGFLNKKLDITREDSIKIHEIIAHKWIFNRIDQENNKTIEKLIALREDKVNYANHFYNQNQMIFEVVIRNGIDAAQTSNYGNNPFIVKDVLTLIDKHVKLQKALDVNKINKELFKAFNLKDVDKACTYTSLIDMFILITPLTENEKWVVNRMMNWFFSEENSKHHSIQN